MFWSHNCEQAWGQLGPLTGKKTDLLLVSDTGTVVSLAKPLQKHLIQIVVRMIKVFFIHSEWEWMTKFNKTFLFDIRVGSIHRHRIVPIVVPSLDLR